MAFSHPKLNTGCFEFIRRTELHDDHIYDHNAARFN